MTGFAESAAQAQGFLESGTCLLTKPLAVEAFLQHVGALLTPTDAP